jgi:hypothetical protein
MVGSQGPLHLRKNLREDLPEFGFSWAAPQTAESDPIRPGLLANRRGFGLLKPLLFLNL